MITIACAARFYFIPLQTYNQAKQAFKDGDYAGAVELFSRVEDFSDASACKERAEKVKAYEEGVKLFEKNRYQDALDAFAKAGDYKDAQEKKDQATRARDYAEAESLLSKDKVFDAGKAFTALGDYKQAIKKAASCAETLLASEQYSKAREIFEELGDVYHEKAESAKKLEGYQKAVESAESSLRVNKLRDALDTYNSVPDTFSYQGRNAGARKQQISAAIPIFDACGTFKAVDPSKFTVTETSKSFGNWNSWEGDANGTGCDCAVRAKLNDDGTVTLSGTVRYYRYLNYSSIGEYAKYRVESKSFEQKVSGTLGTIAIDGETSLNYADGRWMLDWKMVDQNHDVYFDYTYTANYTYAK